MKKLLLLAAFCFAFTSNAHAVIISEVSASLDWSSLVAPTSITIDSENAAIQVHTNALLSAGNNPNLSDSFNDGSGLKASALVNATTLFSDASINSNNGIKSISSVSGRGIDFTANGSGPLTFSIPYLLSLTDSVDFPNESADSLAGVFIILENLTPADPTQAAFEAFLLSSDGISSDSGILSATLDFADGDYGIFGAFTITLAQTETGVINTGGTPVVPEPSTMILATMGLLGFTFSRRKFALKQA